MHFDKQTKKRLSIYSFSLTDDLAYQIQTVIVSTLWFSNKKYQTKFFVSLKINLFNSSDNFKEAKQKAKRLIWEFSLFV